MALPNPNKELVGQSQTQTLTLKDLLFYQKETEKWSENTDVNTYRAYVEEQKATKELAEKIESIQSGEKNSLAVLADSKKGIFAEFNNKFMSDMEQIKFAVAKTFNAFTGPFDKLFEDQRGRFFGDMGENFFSASAQLERGSNKLNSGFKELTNGIGALGPVINSLRTAMFKGVAVFNVVIGFFQVLAGFAGKIIKFFSRLAGFGKEAAEREKLEEEHLKAQNELAEKEAEIAKQEKLEGVKQKLVDPLPLPVTMGGSSSVVPNQEQKKEFKGLYMPDGSMSLEAEEERSKKLMEMDKERAELQKKYDLLDEKRNKKLDEEQGKKSNQFGKMGIALLVVLLAMLMSMGSGFFSAPARLIGETAKRMSRLVGEGAKRLVQGTKNLVNKVGSSASRLFNNIRSTKPNVPTSATRIIDPTSNPKPRTTTPKILDADGKPIKVDEPKVKPKANSALTKALKLGKFAAGEAIPAAGSIYEGMTDKQANEAKFNAIQDAFLSGKEFDFADGPRKITREEYEDAKRAYFASIAGSAGRGGGGFFGALGGFRFGQALSGAGSGFVQGLKGLNPFQNPFKGDTFMDKIKNAGKYGFKKNPVAAVITVGSSTLAGGYAGGTAGDDALTKVFEGDVKDSQKFLDDLSAIAPPTTAEEIDDIQRQILEDIMRGNDGSVGGKYPAVNTAIDNSSSTTIEPGRTSFFDYFNSNSYTNPIHFNSMK